MIIQTERLNLRHFCDEDKKWYCKIVQDSEFKKRLPGLEAEDDTEANSHVELFKKGDFINDFYYVIEDKNGNILGIIVAVRITDKTLDVSYFLFKQYRHKGYMSEAMRYFIKQVKAEIENYYFRMVIDRDNISSLNVVSRLGARVENEIGKYICYI